MCGLPTAQLNTGGILCHIQMTYIVYHIQNGIVNIMWCLPPKYRRKAFYDYRRIEIGKILRDLCEWKGINIIEAEVCIDHVHMLIEVPPKHSISGVMGYLKGKSSQIIFERRDSNIETGVFGREDIMLIPLERIQRK